MLTLKLMCVILFFLYLEDCNKYTFVGWLCESVNIVVFQKQHRLNQWLFIEDLTDQ